LQHQHAGHGRMRVVSDPDEAEQFTIWPAVLCRGLSKREQGIRELAIRLAVKEDTGEAELGLMEIKLWRVVDADKSFKDASFEEASKLIDGVIASVLADENYCRYLMHCRTGFC